MENSLNDQQKTNHTLSEFVQLICENFETAEKYFPKTAAAAEAVHQGFHTLLQHHMKANPESVASTSRAILAIGAHSAWIGSCIDAASGHLASAWSNLRRSIEHTCYAAKIGQSDQRALDWWNQRKDEEARKRFSKECSIPLCYEAEKYSFLWALILAHEESNYYGSHGDVEALWYNFKELGEKKFDYKYQADVKEALLTVAYMVLQGNRILAALREALQDSIDRLEVFDKILNFARDSVNEARSELVKADRPGWLPEITAEAVTNDDRFKQLIAAAKERKRAAQPLLKPEDSDESGRNQ